MKFSIIINSHNQEKFISRSITSCLNQTFKDFEVIIVDTSQKKLTYKSKLKYKNKLKYYHLKSKNKYPEMNQMEKILFGLKKSKGHYVCLMDGDDYFKKDKLALLNKLTIKNNFILNQDNPVLLKKNKIFKKGLKLKKYKNNFIFKSIFNKWPQIFGTSSITVKRKTLINFFKKAKPFNWYYLAIDVQLILFCKINYNIENRLEKITYKNIHDSNLGSTYMNLLKEKFWTRRYMQHKFSNYLNKKTEINLDFIVTSIFYFFFKFL